VSDASNRRKHERLSFNCRLAIRKHDLQVDADACDLSAKGMSFRTSMPFAVGDQVGIRISDAQPAAIAAHVRHVIVDKKHYLVGVEHMPVAPI
jgi:PilZ domain